MQGVDNPYTPGAGVSPRDLEGREELFLSVSIAIERVRRGLKGKSILIVGMCGVGKTVLLDRIRMHAENKGIEAVHLQAGADRSLPAMLAPELRVALLRLSRSGTANEACTHALRSLAGFAGSLKGKYPDLQVGLDYPPESGLADSGVLQQDLMALFEAVGTAAQQSQSAVVLFIDDLQFLPADELAALSGTLHRCAQRGLPVALVGAGLPQLRRRAAVIQPYAEQLFEFLELGALPPAAAARAVRKPAAELNVHFDDDALDHILAATQCHPYFLQELAKQAWNIARRSPVTLQDTRNAAYSALAALDEKFFRSRFERLTGAERKYIRAMAELGPGPHRSGEIAAVLNRRVTSLGPARSQLIAKGLVWSPGHGETAFAVPRFDEYMRRTWPGRADSAARSVT